MGRSGAEPGRAGHRRLSTDPRRERIIALTGRGKSGLAAGLLLNGHTGVLKSTQEILDDLHRSIADRKTKYLLDMLSTIDLLATDEIGYLHLTEDQVNLFFKLMDNRYQKGKSTIITTNLVYDDWGQHFRNSPMVELLKSRIKQRGLPIVTEQKRALRAEGTFCADFPRNRA